MIFELKQAGAQLLIVNSTTTVQGIYGYIVGAMSPLQVVIALAGLTYTVIRIFELLRNLKNKRIN